MKAWTLTTAFIIILAVVVCTAFAMQGIPLGFEATVVVTGICAGIVLCVKKIYTRTHRKDT
jgi:hypothetical protein